MYLLIEIRHDILTSAKTWELYLGRKNFNHMFDSDIFRNYLQKTLGVLRGDI